MKRLKRFSDVCWKAAIPSTTVAQLQLHLGSNLLHVHLPPGQQLHIELLNLLHTLSSHLEAGQKLHVELLNQAGQKLRAELLNRLHTLSNHLEAEQKLHVELLSLVRIVSIHQEVGQPLLVQRGPKLQIELLNRMRMHIHLARSEHIHLLQSEQKLHALLVMQISGSRSETEHQLLTQRGQKLHVDLLHLHAHIQLLHLLQILGSHAEIKRVPRDLDQIHQI